MVVLTTSAEQVREVVTACHELGVPFVARGSGTGLSGGALPVADGALIVLSQMRDILHVDPLAQRAVVQPGRHQPGRDGGGQAPRLLLRARPEQPADLLDRRQRGGELRRRALPEVRLHHQPRARRRHGHAGRETATLGTVAPDAPGYDLLGTVVGSEGTLGVVTEVTVRLTRLPEKVTTLLAGLPQHRRRGHGHLGDHRRGVVPAAIEMMDQLAIEAAEEAVQCGYPAGARAVLVIELDGPAPEVDSEVDDVVRHCEEAGAFEVRHAAGRHRAGADLARAGSRRSRRWAGSAPTTSSRTA